MFDEFRTELESITDVFPDIKSWEKTMIDQFCDLEQELDNDIFKDPKMKSEAVEKLGLMTTGIRDLKVLIPRVDKGISMLRAISFKHRDLPGDDDHQTVCPKWVDLGVENKLVEGDLLSSFLASFHCLSGSQQAKMCSLCLSVFPKNRPSNENKSLSVSSFVIDPWIHRMLILIAKENLFFEFSSEWTPCNGNRRAFLCQENDASHSMRISGEKEAEDLMMVFNVNEQYLRMKPERLRKVEVMQMGRWQNSVTHHIEVEDQKLFNTLGFQKHLKYLSLRGISRVESLPASISKLISPDS
ncbi:hypothetical protein ACS0TY_035778 [Phlomoides rotata]